MIITCPRCFATYNVPDMMLGAAPRKVRCSDCRFEWSETPPPQEAIAALAPDPLPEYLSPAAAAPAASAMPEPVPPPKPVRRDPRKLAVPAHDYSGLLMWLLFIVVTLAGAIVLLREPLGHAAPWLTDLYETIGLPVEGPDAWFTFKGIVLEKTEADGQTVLVVRGQVLNQSRRARTVPAIRLFWREKGGHAGPVSILQARPDYLMPGESARFSGDLVGVDASAGGEVKVTFVTPADAAAGPEMLASPPAEEAAPVAPETAAPAHHDQEDSHAADPSSGSH